MVQGVYYSRYIHRCIPCGLSWSTAAELVKHKSELDDEVPVPHTNMRLFRPRARATSPSPKPVPPLRSAYNRVYTAQEEAEEEEERRAAMMRGENAAGKREEEARKENEAAATDPAYSAQIEAEEKEGPRHAKTRKGRAIEKGEGAAAKGTVALKEKVPRKRKAPSNDEAVPIEATHPRENAPRKRKTSTKGDAAPLKKAQPKENVPRKRKTPADKKAVPIENSQPKEDAELKPKPALTKRLPSKPKAALQPKAAPELEDRLQPKAALRRKIEDKTVPKSTLEKLAARKPEPKTGPESENKPQPKAASRHRVGDKTAPKSAAAKSSSAKPLPDTRPTISGKEVEDPQAQAHPTTSGKSLESLSKIHPTTSGKAPLPLSPKRQRRQTKAKGVTAGRKLTSKAAAKPENKQVLAGNNVLMIPGFEFTKATKRRLLPKPPVKEQLAPMLEPPVKAPTKITPPDSHYKTKDVESIPFFATDEAYNYLLPYLALGFVPQDTPSTDYLCGLYALAISLRAVRQLNSEKEIPETEFSGDQLRALLLYSEDYDKTVREFLRNNDRGLRKAALAEEWYTYFKKDDLDVNQLYIILMIINKKLGTSYQLGYITEGYHGRYEETQAWKERKKKLPQKDLDRLRWDVKDYMWNEKHVTPTSAVIYGSGDGMSPVIWLWNNNFRKKRRDHTGDKSGINHWEGFAPTPNRSSQQRVDGWGLQSRVAKDVEDGVWRVNRITAIETEPEKMKLNIQAGHFVRPDLQSSSVLIRTCGPGANEGPSACAKRGSILKHRLSRVKMASAACPPAPTWTLINAPQETVAESSSLAIESTTDESGTGDSAPFRVYRALPATNKAGKLRIDGDKFDSDYSFTVGDFFVDRTSVGKHLTVRNLLGELGTVYRRSLQLLETPWGLPEMPPLPKFTKDGEADPSGVGLPLARIKRNIDLKTPGKTPFMSREVVLVVGSTTASGETLYAVRDFEGAVGSVPGNALQRMCDPFGMKFDEALLVAAIEKSVRLPTLASRRELQIGKKRKSDATGLRDDWSLDLKMKRARLASEDSDDSDVDVCDVEIGESKAVNEFPEFRESHSVEVSETSYSKGDATGKGDDITVDGPELHDVGIGDEGDHCEHNNAESSNDDTNSSG